jgi:glucokinase
MRDNATRVVLGPGTGLGAGALVHARSTWVPVPGEGGHIDLGPQTERDFAIWPHIERGPTTKHGNRIAAESLISGGGMLRLYRAIAATDGVAPKLTTPEQVTEAGLNRTDPKAIEALTLFATYLGRIAGDFALIFMAYGGVFLSGGIAPRIAAALKGGAFRQAFVDKPPHQALLERMATAIVVQPEAALIGIAAFARSPTLFGVDLTGRRWTG